MVQRGGVLASDLHNLLDPFPSEFQVLLQSRFSGLGVACLHHHQEMIDKFPKLAPVREYLIRRIRIEGSKEMFCEVQRADVFRLALFGVECLICLRALKRLRSILLLRIDSTSSSELIFPLPFRFLRLFQCLLQPSNLLQTMHKFHPRQLLTLPLIVL